MTSQKAEQGSCSAFSSMGHQHGNRHGLKDPAGRAAEHDLPQPRVAIAAHHDQIGLYVGGMGQKRAGNTPRSATRLVI